MKQPKIAEHPYFKTYKKPSGVERLVTLHPTKGFRDRNLDRVSDSVIAAPSGYLPTMPTARNTRPRIDRYPTGVRPNDQTRACERRMRQIQKQAGQ